MAVLVCLTQVMCKRQVQASSASVTLLTSLADCCCCPDSLTPSHPSPTSPTLPSRRQEPDLDAGSARAVGVQSTAAGKVSMATGNVWHLDQAPTPHDAVRVSCPDRSLYPLEPHIERESEGVCVCVCV